MVKSDVLKLLREHAPAAAIEQTDVVQAAAERAGMTFFDATMLKHQTSFGSGGQKDGEWYYGMFRDTLRSLISKTSGEGGIVVVSLDRTDLVPAFKRAEEQARKKRRERTKELQAARADALPPVSEIAALPTLGGEPPNGASVAMCCEQRDGRSALDEWALARFVAWLKTAHTSDATMPPPPLRFPVTHDDREHVVHIIFVGICSSAGVQHITGEPLEMPPSCERVSSTWCPPLVLSLRRWREDRAPRWEFRTRVRSALFTNMGESDMVLFQMLRNIYASRHMHTLLRDWLSFGFPEADASAPAEATALIYMRDTDVLLTGVWSETLRDRARHSYESTVIDDVSTVPPPLHLARVEARTKLAGDALEYWRFAADKASAWSSVKDAAFWRTEPGVRVHMRVCMDTSPRIGPQQGYMYDIEGTYRYFLQQTGDLLSPQQSVASSVVALWLLGASDYTTGVLGTSIARGWTVWTTMARTIGPLVEMRIVSPLLPISVGWQPIDAHIMQLLWCFENQKFIKGSAFPLDTIRIGTRKRLQSTDGARLYGDACAAVHFVIAYNNAGVGCRDAFVRVATDATLHSPVA